MAEVKCVVILAAIDWNFLKQRPQHLAEGFARRGVRVLFIENTGVRTPRLSDFSRLRMRLYRYLRRNSAHSSKGDSLNIKVLSPLALPFPYNSIALAFNLRLLRARIREFLLINGVRIEETVLLSYLGTPLAVALADAFGWSRVIYDLVSDPKIIEPRLATSEDEFIHRADITLFASATLRDSYGVQDESMMVFRDGYSVDLLGSEYQIPDEIERLPRPRLLYIGGMNRKLWADCLLNLADICSESSIILIGPHAASEIKLPQRRNVYYFPPRAKYEELAGILRAADVAMIPYRLDPYSNAMHPAKLNEYMVFGLPIIATRTSELMHLRSDFGSHTLYLADTPDQFAELAKKALSEDTPQYRQARRQIAADNTWDKRVGVFLELMRSLPNPSIAADMPAQR